MAYGKDSEEYDEFGNYIGLTRSQIEARRIARLERQEMREEIEREVKQEVRDDRQEEDIQALKDENRIQQRWINHHGEEIRELRQKIKAVKEKASELDEWYEDEEEEAAIQELLEATAGIRWIYRVLKKYPRLSKWIPGAGVFLTGAAIAYNKFKSMFPDIPLP